MIGEAGRELERTKTLDRERRPPDVRLVQMAGLGYSGAGSEKPERLVMPVATVCAVLERLGLGKLSALEAKPAVARYERARPGELIHVDVKLLARIGRIGHRITGDRRSKVRGIGWEYV